MPDKEEVRCCKCDSDYEEEYYKYEDRIYCFDCLEEKLEKDENMYVVENKHYYNEDWGLLGIEYEIEEVIQNICERYGVERIK